MVVYWFRWLVANVAWLGFAEPRSPTTQILNLEHRKQPKSIELNRKLLYACDK